MTPIGSVHTGSRQAKKNKSPNNSPNKKIDDQPQMDEETNSIEGLEYSSFMIWVDGVGGFLACASIENVIGQAVPNSKASIPITGDIQQSHAKIESVDGGHLLHPVGPIAVDGKPVRSPIALIHNRTFELGDSVSLRYRMPHSYSTTAVIDFESRHRTYPWSDAVLIVGNTILLGPNRNNHVFCPNWKHDVILIRRDDQWHCRCKGAIEVDSKPVEGEGQLKYNSRVEGVDFSLSIEAVG